MERKDLDTYQSCDFLITKKVYMKSEADSVMDAMESRIKELDSIPHTDNTAVIDVLQARIKELENKLYGSSGQSTRLLNRINNFHSTDPKATDLIEDCYKCIHQQMATISKMETTEPKWISVKDRLPEEGVFVYAVGKHLEGLLCFKENEWYTKEEVIDEPNRYWEFEGYYKDAIDYWMEKPLPPTTEENK